MFKRILVAVDGSPASNAGLRSAVELARDQHASLFALHVLDDGSLPINFEGTIYPPTFIDAYFEATHKIGRKVALDRAIASGRGSGVAIKPVLVRSQGHSVAHVIIEQRRKLKADIVVLGTHGRRGLARMLMGSDAEQVLREASVPMLLVHSRAKPSPRRVSAKRRGRAKIRRSPSIDGDLRTATPRSNELR